MIALDVREQTEAVLKNLTPREERIIKLRFGMGDGSEQTLEEVGRAFALTRERIRQVEAKALRKLRHPLRGKRLRVLVEGLSESSPRPSTWCDRRISDAMTYQPQVLVLPGRRS